MLLPDMPPPVPEGRHEGADGDDVGVGDEEAKLDDASEVLVVGGVDGRRRPDVGAEAATDLVAVEFDRCDACWVNFSDFFSQYYSH